MRQLIPAEVHGLERTWPMVWQSTHTEPAFVFDVSQETKGFVGFFLIASQGCLAPSLCLDEGLGFSELSSVSLKAFPISFYHIPLGRTRQVRRVSLRPCTEPTRFKFLAFTTQNALLVAVLHFLFNLRYQHIGVLAPGDAKPQSFWSSCKKNTSRIIKFFKAVSGGEGVRVQASTENVIEMLKLNMSVAAQAVQSRLEKILPGPEPLISFITPSYNTEVAHLNDLLKSFHMQRAPYAELIVTDDGSTNEATLSRLREASEEPGVSVLFNKRNQGIAAATNAGIRVAKGSWVSFIDHDDQFVAGSVAVIADAILQHPQAEFFYTDELLTDTMLKVTGSFCKPSYDSVLLSGMNYINHFSIFRRHQLEADGLLRTEFDGSQDYDLLLRYLSHVKPDSVVHIPYPAYLWRRDDKTYSSVNVERTVGRARQALIESYASKGLEIDVQPALDPHLHRVAFKQGNRPRVSIIIPNKNSLELIRRIVGDIQRKTDYVSLQLIIVDNGSRDDGVLKFYDRLQQDDTATVDICEEPFNFSRMCNRGAALANGEAFLFLNNDIEVLEPHWLEEMVDCLAFSSTGIVGAKLLYPDGSIQHTGVIVGLGQAAGHWYIGEGGTAPGPMGRFYVRQTMSCVTGACMLVSRSCFTAVGGFDEEAFPIAYNDVDFCLRARASGFRTIWTPFAELIHHESLSRGSDETGENAIRFSVEFNLLQQRHGTAGYIDDAYSPLYDRRYSIPHIHVPDGLPPPRRNFFT